MAVSPRALIEKLDPTCRTTLVDEAIRLCMTRTHFYVELEHWLAALLANPNNDVGFLLRQYAIDANKVKRDLDAALNRLKTGNTSAPGLSTNILNAVREAWVFGSLELGAPLVRSAHLLYAMLADDNMGEQLKRASAEFGRISKEKLASDIRDLLPGMQSEEAAQEASATAVAAATGGGMTSGGGAPRAGGKTPALDQFTVNLTAKAKAGMDPVIGRDSEIRQVIDILTRRRQNNPILTGEAGVGKTAVVEGLAQRIAADDVPEPLRNVQLHTLDLGLLQAGAGVKGEFENRLKSVIDEVKRSPMPIILFIDEAHTLIGAGGQAGQNDAANLLKPALARGELRTIAATTFAEYKKYFETDAALKRRFQQVKVDEPDEQKAIRMLRGLVPMLEKHHKVRILDEAIVDAVRLSTRYMPDRQLPDKAVSLIDTVCARVALSQSATPPALDDTNRELQHLKTEIDFLEREGRVSTGNPERVADLTSRKEVAESRKAALEEQLKKEKELVTQIRDKRAAIEKTGADAPEAEKLALAELNSTLTKVQGENPLVYPVVHGGAVAQVVSGLTGIPMGKMVLDAVQTVLKLADKLEERVVGQKHALEAIAQRIRTARADLADPRRPQGVFLLAGPSGVGKTETAMALADLLYGGDRNMVIVNMSEYKESHKVSRLVGTSKGYVGYGEGGVLTNAVKNRPYSVVLLDEVEKAHESVQEIFYQVFDKGVLQNDDGEDVNFKNTIILLTSNAGTDTIMKACADPDTAPSPEGLAEMLKPDLLKAFKPALLGRMTVVPYYPLGDSVLKKIIELKLKQIGDRLKTNYKAAFNCTPAVVDTIAARCKDVDSGARNADHIITGTVLTMISAEVLTRVAEGKQVTKVTVDVDTKSQFVVTVE
ncbi:Chaperone protein ClpB [Gemmata sp. SH-PL17]|nr:type VI secretion system ATPase TssH [Gemmata sp. SH-PL17]AMV29699.1 Chaperone protein ClpB [Gemmata sp. SH-PL17]